MTLPVTTRCWSCGGPIAAEAGSCGLCRTSQFLACGSCGAVVRHGTPTCHGCGVGLSHPGPAAHAQAPSAPLSGRAPYSPYTPVAERFGGAPAQAQVHHPPVTPGPAMPATPVLVIGSFGRRLLAWLLDGLLLWTALAFTGVSGMGWDEAMTGAGTVTLLVVDAIYRIGMHGSSLQATVGKLVMDLRVVRVDGSPVDHATAAKRYLGELVSGLILYIGYVMALFDPQRRALHDRLVGTLVVRRHD